MDEITRIMQRLKSIGKSQKELATHLGVTQALISDWKNGRNRSWPKYLSQIAEFLDTSVDYILGRIDDPEGLPDTVDFFQNTTGNAKLTTIKAPHPMTEREQREKTILELFNQLPKEEQAVILRQAQWMVAQQEQKKQSDTGGDK